MRLVLRFFCGVSHTRIIVNFFIFVIVFENSEVFELLTSVWVLTKLVNIGCHERGVVVLFVHFYALVTVEELHFLHAHVCTMLTNNLGVISQEYVTVST